MAIVKQLGYRRTSEPRSRMNVREYKDYLEKGAMENIPTHYESCSKNWVDDFETTAKLHNKVSNNLAIEYVQSWSFEESKRIGAEKLHLIGIETASEIYPEHQFVVVPQVSDNGNFHNHIVFCAVSTETGKRISSTFTQRKRFTEITDRKCRELGLSIPDRSKPAKEKLSRPALDKLKRGRSPVQLEIMKKADFARRIATDLVGYEAILSVLGITIDDRGKVVTYHHPSRKKGVRDRALGTNYEKGGLNEQFEKNRKEFTERPGLEPFLRGEVKRLFDREGNLVGNSSEFPFAPGGHQRFEKRANYTRGELEPNYSRASNGDRSLNGHAIYIGSTIEQANGRSIVEYCRSQSIALTENDDGSFRLKGRDHILIEGNRWRNTRSVNGKPVGTQGGLMEFVALHKDISYLRALADITGNKRLLVLEGILDFEPVNYKEFHIPKSKKAPEKTALQYLDALAKHFGKNTTWNRAILNSKKVEVFASGAIHFLFGKTNEGAVEHKQEPNGKWIKRNLGVLKGGFLSGSGSSESVKVFSDLFTFMDATKGRGEMAFGMKDSFLVLGDEKDRSLDYFLINNPKISRVELIGFDGRNIPKELSLNLKNHGVSISILGSGSQTRGKEKGPEIGF